MLQTSSLGKILLIDDDVVIADLLKVNLSSEGFTLEVYPVAADVTPQQCADARMVIVDAMSQPYTGIDFTRDLKDSPEGADVPVIVCSAGFGEDDIVDAFDAGADDYITKPFSLRELIARAKAVLRRHPMKTPKQTAAPASDDLIIEVPNLKLRIDTAAQHVVEDGIIVPLTKTEYAILIHLLRNQNSFFTRKEICAEVWRDEPNSNDRIVDTNISRLRKKLGETGKYIINRYGMGYAFVDKLN